MCGFAGILTENGSSASDLEAAVATMTRPLAHRGPDDDGCHVDPEAGLGLGFRRLAILDLTPAGHQPMRSSSGRYVIVFNGEIYNFRDLRRELESHGARFRSDSDTEVMLAAFEQWGIAESLGRLLGMFAFAVWDDRTHSLTLARDRLGIKPLYIHWGGGRILFGSELKALCAAPGFERKINPRVLASYLRYLYVPEPQCIYRNSMKLPPGCYVTIRRPLSRRIPEPTPYWSLADVARSGILDPFAGGEEEAVARLDELLSDAVRRRMVADVSVGALLSGGIDSSSVVAAMQGASNRPVRTFTVAFDRPEHDESAAARALAHHLGTEHTELRIGGQEALQVVPQLPEMFDEPLANPSAIPTYLVCRLARKHVTVALAGDGGDEVFGGYNRYLYGSRLLPLLNRVPRPLRKMGGAVLGTVAPDTWEKVYRRLEPLLPEAGRARLVGTKIAKVRRLMAADDLSTMYRSLLSAWDEPETFLTERARGPGSSVSTLGASWLPSLLDRMMLADQQQYLPGDLLAKVDRASMASSLEVRVPLLDHRLVEFSWRLPDRMKIRSGQTKWALRQLLEARVPRSIWDRPKVGFTVPLEAWLRGPLSDWAGDLLLSTSVGGSGPFRSDALGRAWDRFRSGRGELAAGLWALVAFEAWRDRWGASV